MSSAIGILSGLTERMREDHLQSLQQEIETRKSLAQLYRDLAANPNAPQVVRQGAWEKSFQITASDPRKKLPKDLTDPTALAQLYRTPPTGAPRGPNIYGGIPGGGPPVSGETAGGYGTPTPIPPQGPPLGALYAGTGEDLEASYEGVRPSLFLSEEQMTATKLNELQQARRAELGLEEESKGRLQQSYVDLLRSLGATPAQMIEAVGGIRPPQQAREPDLEEAYIEKLLRAEQARLGRPLGPEEDAAIRLHARQTYVTPLRPPELPSIYREYLLAKEEGFAGTFQEYQDIDANRKRPLTSVYLAGADHNELVEAVIESPELFPQLSPTQAARVIPDLRRRGFTDFGRPLSDVAVAEIAQSETAIAGLKDLRQLLVENEGLIGPIAGLAVLNPYSEARRVQARIDAIRQRIGRALEGGVLRKEDEEKYKVILATIRDVPQTAVYKIDGLIGDLETQLRNYKLGQQKGGRNVPAPVKKVVRPEEVTP